MIVEPAGRDEFLALLAETYGEAMSPAEFDWWFDRNPAGPRILNEARDEDGTPLGVLAMSSFRMSQGLAAFAVHAVTTPAARGRGGARVRVEADGADLPRAARLDGGRPPADLGAAPAPRAPPAPAGRRGATLLV